MKSVKIGDETRTILREARTVGRTIINGRGEVVDLRVGIVVVIVIGLVVAARETGVEVGSVTGDVVGWGLSQMVVAWL